MGRWYRSSHHLPAGWYDAACGVLDRDKVKRLPVAGRAARSILYALGNPRAMSHDLAYNALLVARAASHEPTVAAALADIDRSDALMMNLEGDGIFPATPRRHLLFFLTLAHIALSKGKRVFVLNGMLSADPRSGINCETLALAESIFSRAEVLVVREAASKRFQEMHMPNVNTVMIPDAVFTWRPLFADTEAGTLYDESMLWPFFDRGPNFGRSPIALPEVLRRPYIAVGGSSAAQWQPNAAKPAYAALVSALKRLDLGVVIVESCHGDAFLHDVAKQTATPIIPVNVPILAAAAVLANARLFVSGRWHPSIMASLNGTPSIFLGSNSHKTLSIQEQLAYPEPHEFPVIPSATDIAAIVEEGAALLAAGGTTRRRVAQAAEDLSRHARTLEMLLAV